jgi:hypothetical protein
MTIAMPGTGANYQQGQNVFVAYKYGEGGLTSPVETCAGTGPDGQPIDISSQGSDGFTITATNRPA